MIYMDHHATTPVLPEARDAMRPFFEQEFGNASSASHAWGQRAADAVRRARGEVAALVGARDPDEILFTAGATESDNLAVRGAWEAAGGAGAHIIACAIEHEAVLETCHALQRRGAEVTILPVDRHGLVDPGDVRRALTARTALVSLMMANNEIGTIQPIAEVSVICRERGVLLHTDAVQAVGRIPVDVGLLGVDLMSLTAHKMYGPKGVGALWLRPGVKLEPLMTGGGQERGLRSGTLNVAGIVGFGAAARACSRDMEAEARRQAALRDRLWETLRRGLDGVALNGHPELRLPNNLNVVIEGVEAEAVLTAMRGVAALSAGSACASSGRKGSYVVRALGGTDPDARARSSVRFGLGRANTEDDVDIVVKSLIEAVARLRAMAPAARGAVDALS
ncbi:MAG: cysteine desulfurase family protein [Candidatus Polarisedimenticolia bacterium]